MQLKNQKGIGLVEVIAALGIAVVVITSLVALSLFTLRSSLRGKLLLEGTKIANRELELVRVFRDSRDTWDADFVIPIASCSESCHMSEDGSGFASGAGTSGTGLEQITYFFKATDPDGASRLASGDTVVRISVTARWSVGGETKSTSLYTDLTNWQNK